MRLFIAVYPPASICDAVEDLVRGAAMPDRLATDISWVSREMFHVTLAFLGDVPSGRLPQLSDCLEGVGDRHLPGAVQVRGAGVFRERALWLGIQDSMGDLAAISEQIGEVAAGCGIPVDRRPRQRAHLTVARLRPSARRVRGQRGKRSPVASEALMRLAQAWAVYAGPSWTPSKMALVESEHLDGHVVHRTVRSFPFSGR